MSYFTIPEILLPKKEYDYSKWATIACDQFTSQPDYWESLKYFVGDAKHRTAERRDLRLADLTHGDSRV